ncbi:amidohydrolase family protein [Pseudenhygromyxa sp. WMMC2535]|uniref:amidohydrolase n=1 Tax=Pseudenhygromyxa sp. WMMC2535 TaxID=2712867 RepID=UPI001554AFCE|nr:amidohydrolase [Pseudenhygromyxa sp. WMMC2535]NVB37584.1 amidohydrolase family protein [Pseudenhygromyxa sp. WMMC2535]
MGSARLCSWALGSALAVAVGVGLPGCERGEGETVTPGEGTATPGEGSPDASAEAQRVTLLRGATVMTATGETFAPGAVLVTGATITAVGAADAVAAPEGAEVIELAAGQVLTPGIIDTHSHMGVYASPELTAHSDGNEMVNPITPYARAADGFWPQDPQLAHALAGGVTAAQILPGSANLIGGRSFVIKLRPKARSAEDLRFAGAPDGLKMACGENPKRVYGDKGGPGTRMGNVAGYRAAFQQAVEYQRQWDDYERTLALWETGRSGEGEGDDARPVPPPRDFGLETLAAVLEGETLVHMHCYRADEMSLMLELAASFGFRIRSFHHAVEAYKIADRLAAAEIAASVWADWWGFKAEAFDGVRENAAMVSRAGARAIIHSDSPEGIQRLNQEAAKAMYAGRRAGIEISEDEALRWLTINPAWALGVDEQTGSLEAGKAADLVVWSGDPFSVYTRALQVYIDGELVYAREGAPGRPRSDFDLGLRDALEDAP